MADLRIAVQKKILETLIGGTFYPVIYTPTTVAGSTIPIPSVGTTPVNPVSVQCNEVTSGISDVAKFNPRSKGFVLRNWRFESHIEFSVEVSLSFFFTQELKEITFEVDEYFVSVSLADYTVEHPVQQGSHAGTKATVGFTVNTRR